MESESVAVVMVHRERFSCTRRSLDTLYRHTKHPFSLVCVDAGSPAPYRDEIREASERYGFSLIRTEQVLVPSAARNLGARQAADAPYLLFMDNDVSVSDGWLERLVTCAEETGAGIVGPLYMIGEPGSDRIHMAGGEQGFDESDGERRFFDLHRHSNVARESVGEIARGPVDFVELHAMLMRRDAWNRIGEFDERFLSLFEHSDVCLRARAAGVDIHFEPSAVVTYSPPPRFRPGDRPYFLLRWSEEWNRRTIEHFAAKWKITDMERLEGTVVWAGRHRRKAFHKPLRRFAPLLEPWLTRHVRQTFAESGPTLAD